MRETKPMAEFKLELKFIPCEKCSNSNFSMGQGMRRAIFYFSERIEVRCKQCGHTLVFPKGRAA